LDGRDPKTIRASAEPMTSVCASGPDPRRSMERFAVHNGPAMTSGRFGGRFTVSLLRHITRRWSGTAGAVYTLFVVEASRVAPPPAAHSALRYPTALIPCPANAVLSRFGRLIAHPFFVVLYPSPICITSPAHHDQAGRGTFPRVGKIIQCAHLRLVPSSV